MKKKAKIISKIVFIIIIGVILFFINAFEGNPISRFLADRSAKTYIEETYPDMEFSKSSYSVKTGKYHVLIKSPISIDTHFGISISPVGEIYNDSYEEKVLSKWNTYTRIDREYMNIVDTIFDSDDFIYESDMSFGRLILKEEDIEELEIDKIYDMKELGRMSGDIVLEIEDKEINAKRASEVLLSIKDIFDKQDVLFYTIYFSLEEPRMEEEKDFYDIERFSISEFLYSDIYENDIVYSTEMIKEDSSEFLIKYKLKGNRIIELIDFIENDSERIPLKYIDNKWLLNKLNFLNLNYQRVNEFFNRIIAFFLMLILFLLQME
jgi:hypothetical protein